MDTLYNDPLKIAFARSLRKRSPNTEKRMWYLLRNRQLGGYKFRRQFPIGSYIVDFCCYEHRLIVELDGGQHAERKGYDDCRTKFLTDQKYKVLRFWDNDVLKETDGVCARILAALDARKEKEVHD